MAVNYGWTQEDMRSRVMSKEKDSIIEHLGKGPNLDHITLDQIPERYYFSCSAACLASTLVFSGHFVAASSKSTINPSAAVATPSVPPNSCPIGFVSPLLDKLNYLWMMLFPVVQIVGEGITLFFFSFNVTLRCEGGSSMGVLQHLITDGVVTGGENQYYGGCKPYPFPPCESHKTSDSCPYSGYSTPSCNRTCQSNYNIPYEKDKNFGW